MEGKVPDETATDAFTEFVGATEGKLRASLTVALGVENGREATAEALAYGWQHWDRVQGMENPAGYLYRVGRNCGRKLLSRRHISLPSAPLHDAPWIEPALPDALARLPEHPGGPSVVTVPRTPVRFVRFGVGMVGSWLAMPVPPSTPIWAQRRRLRLGQGSASFWRGT